jgi:hypothetical protein
MADEQELITVIPDTIERAELEIEARRRGMSVDAVATERFVSALESEIARAGELFFGPKSPSKGFRRPQ